MKIAIDCGALCAPKESQYGNYTVTKELLYSLSQIDKKNSYKLYSFCDKSLKNITLSNNYVRNQIYPLGYSKLGILCTEFFNKSDIFLALNQGIPLYTKSKIISFSHGLSFMFYPHLYPDSYSKMRRQVENMVKYSAYLIVSSTRVYSEFQQLYPEYKNIVVNPFGIPHDMIDSSIEKKFLKDRRVVKLLTQNKYFLYVGMDHPIKNINVIVDAFTKAQKQTKEDIYLYLVGLPCKYEKYSDKIKTFSYLDRLYLKLAYQNALSLVTASLYESFNLPILEALSQNCSVVGYKSAIIPELARFCNITDNPNSLENTILNITKKKRTKTKYSKNLLQKFNWIQYSSRVIKLY